MFDELSANEQARTSNSFFLDCWCTPWIAFIARAVLLGPWFRDLSCTVGFFRPGYLGTRKGICDASNEGRNYEIWGSGPSTAIADAFTGCNRVFKEQTGVSDSDALKLHEMSLK